MKVISFAHKAGRSRTVAGPVAEVKRLVRREEALIAALMEHPIRAFAPDPSQRTKEAWRRVLNACLQESDL